MRSSYYVGVSFLKGKIQLAEVEHKRRKLTVTVLAERDTSIDFTKIGTTLSADHPHLNKFAQELKEIIKQNDISTEYISFALPPDPVFINIIPVDPGHQKMNLPNIYIGKLSNISQKFHLKYLSPIHMGCLLKNKEHGKHLWFP